jgi:hypothetical protein
LNYALHLTNNKAVNNDEDAVSALRQLVRQESLQYRIKRKEATPIFRRVIRRKKRIGATEALIDKKLAI